MTRDDIERRLQHIRDLAHDDEAAHAREDELHQAVLFAISAGALVGISAGDAASLALSTQAIAFARWYA